MSLLAGSVDVDGAGAGLAKELWDQLSPKFGDALKSPPTFLSDLCNSIATGVIGHLVANAVVQVHIAPSDGGLQRLPLIVLASEDTQGPSAPKTLSGTLT